MKSNIFQLSIRYININLQKGIGHNPIQVTCHQLAEIIKDQHRLLDFPLRFALEVQFSNV